jgi:hypothetical protein
MTDLGSTHNPKVTQHGQILPVCVLEVSRKVNVLRGRLKGVGTDTRVFFIRGVGGHVYLGRRLLYLGATPGGPFRGLFVGGKPMFPGKTGFFRPI